MGVSFQSKTSITFSGFLQLAPIHQPPPLPAKLPGYSDYAKRVRYRLLPGVW